MNRKIETFAMC